MKRGLFIALGTMGGLLIGYVPGAWIASSSDCGGECWTGDAGFFAFLAFPLIGAFLGGKLAARKTRRKP